MNSKYNCKTTLILPLLCGRFPTSLLTLVSSPSILLLALLLLPVEVLPEMLVVDFS